jgi:hypothetical protein
LRIIDGVGVQAGLNCTANIDASSSGVEAAGLPTTTRLRRTGTPSWRAISSKDGMFTRMNLPCGGMAVSTPWLRSMLT